MCNICCTGAPNHLSYRIGVIYFLKGSFPPYLVKALESFLVAVGQSVGSQMFCSVKLFFTLWTNERVGLVVDLAVSGELRVGLKAGYTALVIAGICSFI